MNRNWLLTLLSFFALAAQAQTNAPPSAAPSRPNIILIIADNLGCGDIGAYGQKKIRTPNLDRLANEGIRFTSFYAASPDEAPARAALLTGLEPRHSNAGFNQAIATDASTIGSFLQKQGYRTGLIGVWGLGDTGPRRPEEKGFDEFAGFLSVNHSRQYYSDRLWRHDPVSGFDGQVEMPQNQNGQRGFYLPDLLTTSSVNFIRNNKPEPYSGLRPFFLCLTYPVPHPGAPLNFAPYSNEPWPQAEKDRAAVIARMDEGIGRVLGRLEQMKVDTNTIILFTSVGGPKNESGTETETFQSTGPLRGLSGSMYEGGLRVPLIVHWPGKIKAGQVNDLPCSAVDLCATLMEIASPGSSVKLDGLSLVSALNSRRPPARHEQLYWESTEGELKQAVREGDWKAVRLGTNALELYNLKTDPAEKQNVAAKNTSVVERMEKALKAAKP